jgi:hypothetical protein
LQVVLVLLVLLVPLVQLVVLVVLVVLVLLVVLVVLVVLCRESILKVQENLILIGSSWAMTVGVSSERKGGWKKTCHGKHWEYHRRGKVDGRRHAMGTITSF